MRSSKQPAIRAIHAKAGVNAEEMQDIVTLLHGSYTTNPDLATANLINIGIALIECIDRRTSQEIGNISLLLQGIYDFHTTMGLLRKHAAYFSVR
jgi:hypothetical protein